MSLPELRCGLEGVGELEHARVVVPAAHDLDPDGQTLRCETAWHGDGWKARERDEVAGLHPVYVRLHIVFSRLFPRFSSKDP